MTALADELLAHAASIRRRGPICWTCSLPADLLKAIHEARKQGAEVPAIVSYLIEKRKYPAKEAARVKNHFNNRHHVR